MEVNTYSEKNQRIQLGDKSMRNAMFLLVLALVATIIFFTLTVIELYEENWKFGLFNLIATIVSCLFAVHFGKRYKKHHNSLNKYLFKNPSIYKKLTK